MLPQCSSRIAKWFDDYNESHPHSGLGMISPKGGKVAECPVEWGQHQSHRADSRSSEHHNTPDSCD
jgi:Integrase core domain